MSLWVGVVSAKTVAASQWQTPLTNEAMTTTLAHYKGQVIWLDFWASWCGPCRASFPWLNKMQQRYGKKGLKVIAVNVDADREDAKKFLRQIPASFQVSFDPEGAAPALFDIQGMPTSVLIDRQGEIHLFHVGFHKAQEAEMESLIKKTLKL
jgi:thiol-disulfide isomerase/thioredoxin